jgi:hypothetical protein
MKVRRLLLAIVAVGIIYLAAVNSRVQAAHQPNPGKASIALMKLCNDPIYAGTHPLSCWLAVYDPPGPISEFSLQLHFDPTKMSIDPADAGFLCDFSSNGSCPVTSPSTVTDPGGTVTLGGPRLLTNYTLNISGDTLTLHYDMSGNPTPTASGDRNVFGFYFHTSQPVGSFTFTNTPGTGDSYQVAAGGSCNGVPGGACSSDTPVEGFSMTFVPEPSTLGFGFIALSAIALSTRANKQARKA